MKLKQQAKCIILLMLALGVATSVVARVNDDVTPPSSSTSKPKTAAELKGTVIDYANRASYWTVGQPTAPSAGQSSDDVMRRIFMFYNYKTGKFLSLGGWWGMRTVLNDYPYLFWLQRRNEKQITTSNIVRYPVNKGETTVVPSLLENMLSVHQNRPRPVYVGSNYTDGSKETETYATFNYIRLINNATKDAAESVTELTKPATLGEKFSSTINNLDLTKQRIEAEIDLSTCKKNNETVLSIGSDITRWGWGDTEKRALVDNIHIFYNGTNTDGKLKAHQLEVVYLGINSGANGIKHEYYNVNPDTPVKVVLSDKGLTISIASKLMGGPYYKDYVSNLNQNGKIQVGSRESTISHATYHYLRIMNADGTKKADIQEEGFTPNAKFGGENLDFDINNEYIEAELDVTNCVSGVQKNNKGKIVDDENILSFGDAIATWGGGYHIHLYYTQNTNNLEMVYLPHKHSDDYRTNVTIDPSQPLYLRLDKNGLSYSNGTNKTITETLFSDINLPLQYADGNRMDIGTVQGANRSNATYNSVKLGDADLTEAFNAADKTKGYSTSQVIDINSQSLDAEIDLSTCTGSNENILSFGDDAAAWPNSHDWYNNPVDSIGRIHLYYTKGKTLTIWYVGRGQQMQFDRAVDATKPLTIHFSKAKGLVIDGTQYYGRLEIPYTEGLEGEQVRFKNVKNNVPEVDADGNYIIDQEGGHGITRVYTNYIYANESRSDKRQTYFIASNFAKSAGFSTNEGNLLAYTNMEAAKADYNTGTYGDRVVLSMGGMNSPEVSQWSIDPVTDPSGKGQNLYTLSLTMTYNAESSKGEGLDKAKQFFLAPTQKYVYGPDGNKYYDSDTNESGQYATDEYTDVELTSTQSELNYWKVISLYDYRQIMDNSDSELRNQVDASFLISDANFMRENAVLNRWQSTVDTEHLRIGYDGYYKTSPADISYTKTNKGENDRYNHARYMAANIYNGGRGQMYQDIKVFTPGWYVVHCKGMTNVGAKLFIERVNTISNSTQRNTKELTTITADELATLRSSDTNVAHWPMDADMPLYNSAVWMNDPYRLNADLDKYDNQVLLYIDNISIENPATLRIGVRVDDGKEGVATADEWTVFDDFRIQFGGASAEKEPFLILDEDKTSLSYIDDGVHPYMGKSLLLHRTFKENQWNTFILPVSLTKKQYVGAFGEESRLAELSNLTTSAINFTSVNITGAADDDVVLKAGEPYIIKPTKLAGNTSDGTQEIWTWASNGETSEKVSVGTPYYTILGVTLDGPKVTADNEFEHYNFTSASATFNGAGYYTDGTVYVKASEGKDGDGRGTMVMKGVYCKNYTGSTINDGHASLNLSGNQYAYVMNGNDMKRLPQDKPYGTKGFRCWFEYTLNSATQAAPQVVIDGIGGEVTSIDDIQDDIVPTATRYANGVYNLNGQMLRQGNNTDGLESGIYIVNGKKVLVNSK